MALQSEVPFPLKVPAAWRLICFGALVVGMLAVAPPLLAEDPQDAVESAVDSDPLKAASELDVDAVLDGSFQRSGNRLRVNMTLLRAGDGAALWSRTFNADVADIFAIEDEISQQVVSQLRVQLRPEQQLLLVKHHTSRPEAYEYYLKGVAKFGTVGGASPTVVGDVEVGL